MSKICFSRATMNINNKNLLTATIANYCPVDLKACILATYCHNECDVEWLV